MSYYFNTTLQGVSFDEAKQKITEALKSEGFGVLTEIDMKATLKKKLDEDIRPYTILGACNPPFAFKALQAEPKIGLMLPCNVIVQENEAGDIEVSAVDPVASMTAVQNDQLNAVAAEVEQRLKKVINSL